MTNTTSTVTQVMTWLRASNMQVYRAAFYEACLDGYVTADYTDNYPSYWTSTWESGGMIKFSIGMEKALESTGLLNYGTIVFQAPGNYVDGVADDFYMTKKSENETYWEVTSNIMTDLIVSSSNLVKAVGFNCSVFEGEKDVNKIGGISVNVNGANTAGVICISVVVIVSICFAIFYSYKYNTLKRDLDSSSVSRKVLV